MIVNTPDGQVSFPDSMSADDIQGVLRQKYGHPSAPAGAPPTSANSPPTPGAPAAPDAAPGLGQRITDYFTKPTVAAGDTPAAFNAGPATIGQQSVFEKPADVSMNDFMLAHLSELGKGMGQIGQAADDYARVASNTYGLGDRLASTMGGTDIAAERAKTQAARERLGPIAYAADMTGGGPLGKVAELGGGGFLANMAVGGGAGYAGGVGRGDASPLTDAVMGAGGAGLGTAAGKTILGPLANWGAKGATALGQKLGFLDNPADVTAATKAARDAAYDTMKNTSLDIGDTRQALQGVRNAVNAMDPTGGFQKNAPRSMAILDNLQDFAANSNDITAHDLVSLGLDKLRNIPDTAAAGGENELKPAIQKGLENFLDSGPAAGQLDAARDAHATYKNAQALQQWSQGLKDFGSSPASAAQDAAQTFYSDPAKKAQYDALARIANAGGGGQSAWGLMHAAHEPIDMAAAAAGLGHMAGPVGAAVSYGAFKPAASALLKRGQAGAVQDAIASAYPALTGRTTAFQTPEAFGEAMRQLMLSRAAAGRVKAY
jgi:hypothetical protein